MKNPIIRLTIGQNVTLSGHFINHNEKVMPIFNRYKSEYAAQLAIEAMRDGDNEFQIVIIRQAGTMVE